MDPFCRGAAWCNHNTGSGPQPVRASGSWGWQDIYSLFEEEKALWSQVISKSYHKFYDRCMCKGLWEHKGGNGSIRLLRHWPHLSFRLDQWHTIIPSMNHSSWLSDSCKGTDYNGMKVPNTWRKWEQSRRNCIYWGPMLYHISSQHVIWTHVYRPL